MQVGLTVLTVIYNQKMKSAAMLNALITADVLLQLIYYLVWPGKLARRLPTAGWMLILSALLLGGLAFGIRATDRCVMRARVPSETSTARDIRITVFLSKRVIEVFQPLSSSPLVDVRGENCPFSERGLWVRLFPGPLRCIPSRG